MRPGWLHPASLRSNIARSDLTGHRSSKEVQDRLGGYCSSDYDDPLNRFNATLVGRGTRYLRATSSPEEVRWAAYL
jgi:hypothetical protein